MAPMNYIHQTMGRDLRFITASSSWVDNRKSWSVWRKSWSVGLNKITREQYRWLALAFVQNVNEKLFILFKRRDLIEMQLTSRKWPSEINQKPHVFFPLSVTEIVDLDPIFRGLGIFRSSAALKLIWKLSESIKLFGRKRKICISEKKKITLVYLTFFFFLALTNFWNF